MNRREWFTSLGAVAASKVVGVESPGQTAAHAMRTVNDIYLTTGLKMALYNSEQVASVATASGATYWTPSTPMAFTGALYRWSFK